MTIGSRYFGNAQSPLYSSKDWSGSDDPMKRSINNYSVSGFVAKASPSGRYNYSDGAYVGDVYLVDSVKSRPPYNDGDVINIALARLANKVRGHDFNAGSFIAESGQAAQQVLNSLNAIANCVIQLKRGNVRNAFQCLGYLPGQREAAAFRKALKAGDISSAFLAMKFGIEPLIGDCQEALLALEALNHQRSTTVTSSARTKSGPHEFSVNTDMALIPGTYYSSVKLVYTIEEQVSPWRSLSISNPITALWEITPWSFLLDYALNIGQWLDNLGFFSSLSGHGYMSYKRYSVSQMTSGPEQRAGNLYYTYKGGTYSCQSFEFTRTVGLPEIPLPRLKDMEKIFSTAHLLNVGALLHQQFTSAHNEPYARNKWVQFDKLDTRKHRVWNSIPLL